MVQLSYVDVANELGLTEIVEGGETISADDVLRGIVNDYNTNLDAQGIERTKDNKMSLKRVYDTLKDNAYFLKQKEIYEADETKSKVDPIVDYAIKHLFGSAPTHKITPARPQILQGDEKEAYDQMIDEQLRNGTDTIKEIYDSVVSGNYSHNLAKIGFKQTSIPNMPKLVEKEDITQFIYDIQNARTGEVESIVREFETTYQEQGLVLNERLENMLQSVVLSKTSGIDYINT